MEMTKKELSVGMPEYLERSCVFNLRESIAKWRGYEYPRSYISICNQFSVLSDRVERGTEFQTALVVPANTYSTAEEMAKSKKALRIALKEGVEKVFMEFEIPVHTNVAINARSTLLEVVVGISYTVLEEDVLTYLSRKNLGTYMELFE